jgi:hypothetical protein
MAAASGALTPASAPLAVFAPVLELLTADAAVHFGTAVRLEPCSYTERPFSHVLRVDVRRNGDGPLLSRVFVKIFKPKPIPGGPDALRQRVAHEFETTRRVHAWLSPHRNLGAVPPVACYPAHLAIVTEEVKGPTLLAHLHHEAAWLPSERQMDELGEIMATVGRWVRTFQGMEAHGSSLTVAAIREYIDHRLQRLVRDAPRYTESHRQLVLAHVDALGQCIGSDGLIEVPIHADMSLGNLLVDGRRIVVLDFAMATAGSSLYDLTRLYVQLDLLAVKPHIRPSVIRRLQQALIHGFDESLVADRPMFRLHLLLHRINHFTTLSVNRASFLEDVYNGAVRRQHRRWLDAELRRGTAISHA